ncbi:MAG: AmmeMemoRadiSam system radical SAM enzyme [Bacillota bacterium]
MREALNYEKLEHDSVRCHVCNLRCVIKEGKRGVCGVRENMDGTLYALNYGKTIASGIDPIEKKPLYHFHPHSRAYSLATVGCNMRCPWCQNWRISQSPRLNKTIEGREMSPEEHVQSALTYDCEAIAYTYSEPTIFLEYAYDIMKLAKKHGLKNLWISNGNMTDETLDLIIPYIDAANIDYKGPYEGVYEKYCNGHAKDIMHSMVRLKEAGIHLEVTTLIIPGVNDQEHQLKAIAHEIASNLSLDTPWHISRFFPAWKMKDTPVTPIDTLNKAKMFGEKEGIKHIHLGNV